MFFFLFLSLKAFSINKLWFIEKKIADAKSFTSGFRGGFCEEMILFGATFIFYFISYLTLFCI